MSQFKIKNALISLTDKNKIEIVAKELTELGIKIISTGGTAKYLKSYSIEVDDISEITNFPEILGGRVKSLHPKIFLQHLPKFFDFLPFLQSYLINSFKNAFLSQFIIFSNKDFYKFVRFFKVI